MTVQSARPVRYSSLPWLRTVGIVVPALAVFAAACSSGSGPTSGAGGSSPSESITVFAASSLRAAMTELAASLPDVRVTFSFDGSASLLDQLAAGAPADVLAVADQATMISAVDQGLAVEPVTVATNSPVLVVPPANPAGITGLDGSLTAAKLVICEARVPCGAAARRLADAAGTTLRPVSEENTVSDVRGKVESGEADAGIVYRTDAVAAGAKLRVIEVPGSQRIVNAYLAAATARSGRPDAARRFVAALTSPAGRAVFESYGFSPPGPPPT